MKNFLCSRRYREALPPAVQSVARSEAFRYHIFHFDSFHLHTSLLYALLLCLAFLLGSCGRAANFTDVSGSADEDAAEVSVFPSLIPESEGAGAGQAELMAGDGGNPALRVYCFSAGKADAMLLYTDNSAVLIDTGRKGFGKEILAYLEAEGISSLDKMIITHFDKDHVGGAAKLLHNIPIGEVLQSNYPKESEEYESGIVAQEMLRGYTYHDSVVRHSMVAVVS